MKKNSAKKLSLAKETVLLLDNPALAKVLAGAKPFSEDHDTLCCAGTANCGGTW